MPLNDDLIKIIDQFDEIYSPHSRIDSFQKSQKMSILENLSVPLFPIEDEMFSEFHIHPKDMNFEIQTIPKATWDSLLKNTSSAINDSASGKSIRLVVKETRTNKFVGLIRLGSPIINCKPRNILFGKPFTSSKELSASFNNSVMMGFVIVPMQPFGFNYLGGKLLAGICCSHEIREMIDRKYGTEICMFETTSLYGSSKSVSQYDGMDLYLKYKGTTESNFIPVPSGKSYDDLKFLVDSIDKTIVVREGTSKKLKTMNKIISYVNKNLSDDIQKQRFNNIINHALSLTEKKRYYISSYGFSNSIDHIVNNSPLSPSPSFDKFYLPNIINYWKNKSSKRYTSLVSQNRLRTSIELQSNNLDIIR